MSPELIALTMFASMLVLLLTGQRVFGAIGFIGSVAAMLLWGTGGQEIPFNQAFTLMNWYPLLTIPLFIYMGYIFSESGIADDLYKTFHVWFGPVHGGLAIGTIGLMVVISAMNGLSVAGMAIGATVALPELLKRGYDKIMVTGVVQGGSTLGILIPPSVVLVLYAMIARQPVGQLWLAGVFPGLMMAAMFILYIYVRCRLQPHLGPPLPPEERDVPLGEQLRLLRYGLTPLVIFLSMTGLFLTGITNLTEFERGRGAGLDDRRLVARAALLADARGGDPPDPRHQRDVPLDHPRRARLRRGVRRPRRRPGAGAALRRRLGARPMGGADHDAGPLPDHGDVPRRHRDARHRRAALRAAGDRARVRPDLVRRALHHHLPDRLHHAAVRLQPVPDAGDGAAGDHPARHLPLDRAVRADHAGGARRSSPRSRRSRSGCRSTSA